MSSVYYSEPCCRSTKFFYKNKNRKVWRRLCDLLERETVYMPVCIPHIKSEGFLQLAEKNKHYDLLEEPERSKPRMLFLTSRRVKSKLNLGRTTRERKKEAIQNEQTAIICTYFHPFYWQAFIFVIIFIFMTWIFFFVLLLEEKNSRGRLLLEWEWHQVCLHFHFFCEDVPSLYIQNHTCIHISTL